MALQRAVYIVSLGCPKNFCDTESLSAKLIENGYALCQDENDAGIYLINTCAFIEPARLEARDFLGKAVSWKKRKRDRIIVVTGCLNAWDKDGHFRNDFPDVDLWLDFTDYAKITTILASMLTPGQPTNMPPTNGTPVNYMDLPRLQLTPPHYAYLKISEGCNNRCSYCTIPSIRGPLQSRNIDAILSDAENLLQNGVKELILIGQDTCAFGYEQCGDDSLFLKLISRLDQLDHDFWLRLMYFHPAHITDRIIEMIANANHVIPYLDIPLQHISDPILKKMNRKISSQDARNLINKLRKNIANLAIRTTFIVGFPGETEHDFGQLADFVCEEKFERMGAFQYYAEAGTQAADLPGHVPDQIAAERLSSLMERQRQVSAATNQSLIGRELNVIIDQVDRKQAAGRSTMDAPEIDNQVFVRQTKRSRLKPGKIVKVRIDAAYDYAVKGNVV